MLSAKILAIIGLLTGGFVCFGVESYWKEISEELFYSYAGILNVLTTEYTSYTRCIQRCFCFQCGKSGSTKVTQITCLAVQKMEVYGTGMDLTLMHLLWLLAREKVLIYVNTKEILIYYVKFLLP